MDTRRVAFITGAAGGLGSSMVRRLAADGFQVIAADIDADSVAQAVDQVDGARAIVLDVSDVDAVREAIDRAADGAELAVLVNNAAVFPHGPFVEVTVEDYDAAHSVNQRAYFFCAQAAARHMIGQRSGIIVNMGSITERGSWAEIAAYATAKGAAGALTRALATDLGPHNIRVNCIAPGAFSTPAEDMQPDGYEAAIFAGQALPFRGHTDDVAGALSFLCSGDARFITGHTLTVDGGWKMG